MERVAFPRRDVQAWLSGMVCMKVNAGGDGGHPLATKFGVRGFPTLVLIEPSGKVVFKQGGSPPPDQFSDGFAGKRYNAAVKAHNEGDWKQCAPHLFFVRKWFKGTPIGDAADDMYKSAASKEAFAKAYAAIEAEYAKRLEAKRSVLRKQDALSAEARKMMDEAEAHMKKFKRYSAFTIYKKVILQYPGTPEADEARAVLRKHKKKWKEPAGR